MHISRRGWSTAVLGLIAAAAVALVPHPVLPRATPAAPSPERTAAEIEIALLDRVDGEAHGDIRALAALGLRDRWTARLLLEPGDGWSRELGGDRTLRVTLAGHRGEAARVRIRLYRRGRMYLDSTMGFRRGYALPLIPVSAGNDGPVLLVTRTR
jgi:hypothetical protein